MIYVSNFTLRSLYAMLVSFLLVPLVVSYGQSSEDFINTQISCLSLDKNIRGLKIESSGEIYDLRIYTSTRSKLLDYSGSRDLVFFREQVSQDGAVVRVPVGQVRIQGDPSRCLLFFSKKNSETEGYNIFSMLDSNESFKPGTFRFINLAPFDIAIKINQEERMLKKRQPTDVRGDFENGKYQMTAMVSLLEGQDPFLSYSGRIHYNENMRMIYIILPEIGGRPGEIQFKAIPDLVQSKS